MKIAISIIGRFHLFNLANQLLKYNYLSQLITSYPKFLVRRFGIPKSKVRSVVIKEILQRSWEKLPNILRDGYDAQYFFHKIFDKGSARRLDFCEILVAGQSSFPRTMRKAKNFGALVIVENGSAHTLYQQRVMREEYDKFGIKPGLFQISSQRIVENELKAYEEMDFISVPSIFAKRTFLDYNIPERKLIHVPYGIDLLEFHQVKRVDNVFRVIFVGAMTLQKGVHYLLQAFSELNLKNVELMLVGALSEEISPFFKKYNGNFNYISHLPQSELYRYYSQASVFVLNSLQDGFGMVMIQAMACGLPVICTTNTGGEDVVRDGTDGFIIPIRDVEKLKEKLLYLYENQEMCERMGQSAKERVAYGFTWDDYGDRIIKEYKRILAV